MQSLFKTGREQKNKGGQNLITGTRLYKRYANKTVLRDINLEVRTGDILALIGPNGAGKTTLLRILCGLCKASSGEVCIDGQSLDKNMGEMRKHIGFVGPHSLLYDGLSAAENLSFYGRLYTVDDLEDRIFYLLDRFGLLSVKDDSLGKLSSGMQQRLAIARALLHDPIMLFLDEPFNSLDRSARDQLEAILREWQIGQKCLLMASHDLSRAAAFANRGVILTAGSIRADIDLYSHSADQLLNIYDKYAESSPAAVGEA